MSQSRIRLLALFGSGLLLTGVYLPWVMINPFAEGHLLLIVAAGMKYGFFYDELTILATCGAVGALLSLVMWNRSRRLSSAFFMLAGVTTVGLLFSASVDLRFVHQFVPAPGWFLSLVGSVIVFGIGLCRLSVDPRNLVTRLTARVG